jgi:hypothetical protein
MKRHFAITVLSGILLSAGLSNISLNPFSHQTGDPQPVSFVGQRDRDSSESFMVAASPSAVNPKRTESLASRQDQAIPWDQLGARATRQYSGDGLAVVPTADGAQLKCTFQKISGLATREGLWLDSNTDNEGPKSLRVRAVAIGRGFAQIERLPDTGEVCVHRGVARWNRDGLAEEYSVSIDGLRQDFIVERDPAGHGPLRVTLEVVGATVAPFTNGVTLVASDSGRTIAYNKLRVTDCNSRELAARMEISAGTLSVIVEDQSADYPIRIDPTFSDADWIGMGKAPGFDRPVMALAVDTKGNLYAGGYFTLASNDATILRIAKWDGDQWSSLGSGIGTISDSYATVNAIAISGDHVYVGGVFETAGGVKARSIARWNGFSWSALGAGIAGEVNAITISGSNIFAGGSFNFAGGLPARGIARWNGTSWSPLGSGILSLAMEYNEETGEEELVETGGPVSAIAASGNEIYVGGSFTTAGGVRVNSIAKWNGSTWSDLGGGVKMYEPFDGMVNGYVHTLLKNGTDLLVGGVFSEAGDVAAGSIARWNGSSWSRFGDDFGSVNSIVSAAGNIFALTSRGDVSKWNGNRWDPVCTGISGGILKCLAISGNDIYVGGDISTVGGMVSNNIAKWNGSSWIVPGDTAGSHGINGPVHALTVFHGELYAGGEFTTAGGVPANCIARWNGDHWSNLGDGFSWASYLGCVYALEVFKNQLYAGGRFDHSGSVSLQNIAKWDGGKWSPLGQARSDLSETVRALEVFGGDLYVGGSFKVVDSGNIRSPYLAKWNGESWIATYGFDNHVYALAASNTNLYVGGAFKKMNHIARWNGTKASPLGLGVSGSVHALAVSGDDVYAGGNFRHAGGLIVNNVAKWNGSSWEALGSGVVATSPQDVRTLLVAEGEVYLGVNTNSLGGILKWNGNVWKTLGTGVGTRVNGWWYEVGALVNYGGRICAAGSFDTAGRKASQNIAFAEVIPDPITRAPEITIEQPPGRNRPHRGPAVRLGTVDKGAYGSWKTFTIRNTGTASLTGIRLERAGIHQADFVVKGSALTSLAPGRSTTFSVSFRPSRLGVRVASLKIASNDRDENPFEILLTGTGKLPEGPEITVEHPAGSILVDGRSRKGFGTIKRGKTGAVKTFSIRNVGNATMTNLAVSLGGSHPNDYVISQPGLKSLRPGTSTTFKVSFKPTATGTRTALLKISSSDKNENPFDIVLTGLGVN